MTLYSREIKDIARATIEVAKEKRAVAQVVRDLKRFEHTRSIEESLHPIALGALAALLRRELLASFNPFLQNLVTFARDIAQQYEVRVTSALPLRPEERESLLKILRQRLDGTVALEERIDTSILGGLILAIDAWQFDASVQGQIRRLHKRLALPHVARV